MAIESLTLGHPYGQELLQAVLFGIKKESVCPAMEILPLVTYYLYLLHVHTPDTSSQGILQDTI